MVDVENSGEKSQGSHIVSARISGRLMGLRAIRYACRVVACVLLVNLTGCHLHVTVGGSEKNAIPIIPSEPTSKTSPATSSSVPPSPQVSSTPSRPGFVKRLPGDAEDSETPLIAASVPLSDGNTVSPIEQTKARQEDSNSQQSSGRGVWQAAKQLSHPKSELATFTEPSLESITKTSAVQEPAILEETVPFSLLVPAPASEAEGELVDSEGVSVELSDASEELYLPMPDSEVFPIDLPTVLRLAGGQNWSIRLASERVREAGARLDQAKALWIPSLIGGLGYTKHDGQIQATTGEVIDVSRNSFFLGGGMAGGQNAPLTGGAGGPARLMVDLSLTDAIFQPLAARKQIVAAEATQTATFNDTLLAVSIAYYDLIGAQGERVLAGQNIEDGEQLLELTESFVAAGKGSAADVSRIRVELSNREQQKIQAELAMKLASAELANLLNLDSSTELYAHEEQPVAVEFIDEQSELSSLIVHAQAIRPERVAALARSQSLCENVRAEKWRPWIPNLFAGMSGGGFGGGSGSSNDGLEGRADFDLLAVWEVKNLGFGTQAARDEVNSLYQQSLIEARQIDQQISMEVSQSYHSVRSTRQQMKLSEERTSQAIDNYDRNLARIRGLEGIPLEAVQAMQVLADARERHLLAIIAYNQSQMSLMRAIGQQMMQ